MDEKPCPYVTGTVTRYCTLTPFTLSDAEREAIEQACDEGRWYPKDYHHIHTLQAILERTKCHTEGE